ncbi:unnamed protein product [Thelazia callipaeda]|uniref:Skp1 domain-containing protein n=1 Tax=Thelazia callipaeda TaxID=103827 RepID=A0A0N5D220_THECL|nr:unnamed protein product [Thelazia callipaeda]
MTMRKRFYPSDPADFSELLQEAQVVGCDEITEDFLIYSLRDWISIYNKTYYQWFLERPNCHLINRNHRLRRWVTQLRIHKTQKLLLAASFLQMDTLLDDMCNFCAGLIAARTPEEIERVFGIEYDSSDSTEEELLELQKKGKWFEALIRYRRGRAAFLDMFVSTEPEQVPDGLCTSVLHCRVLPRNTVQHLSHMLRTYFRT